MSNRRVCPKPWDPYYVMLTQLTSSIESYIHHYLNQHPKGVVVDYGCDFMPYKVLFKDYRYLGVDIQENAAADIYLTQQGTVPLEDASVDVVLSTQVLEHVTDPDLYLRECWRLLKPGGHLILSTHGTWVYHPFPQDLWRWTSAGLRKIVSAHNFSIVEFHGILSPLAIIVQLFELRAQNFLNRLKWIGMLGNWFIELLIRACDSLEKPVIRNQDAAIYVLLAAKPAEKQTEPL